MATKEKTAKRKKCLTCPNKAFTRGLCAACRAAASAAIHRGDITEQELIDAGKMLPAQRAGRPRQSGMARALENLAATK